MGKGKKNVKRAHPATKNVFHLSANRTRKSKDKKSKPVTTNLKQLNLKTRESVRNLDKKDINVQLMTLKTKKEKPNIRNPSCLPPADIDTVMGEMKKL